MNKLEKYPEVSVFLEKVTNDLRSLLSDNLLGVYVWGSLATNSFKNDISDIDCLVVIKDEVDEEELSKLQDWANKLMKEEKYAEQFDAVLVTSEKMNNGDGNTSQGGIEFWKGELQRTDNCLGDNPLVLDTVRKTGVCLHGHSAEELIEPITRDKIVNSLKKELRELRNGVKEHFDDIKWRYYAVTTLCRMLYTSQTGNYLSKKEALMWYIDNFHSRDSLINSALAFYERDDSRIKATEASDYESFIQEVEDSL